MRSRYFAALATAGLAGCSSVPLTDSGYGSFVTTAPAEHEAQMADDAARQLVTLFPPARTRFTLAHAAQDRFGQQLMDKLRGDGYALQEIALPASSTAGSAPETATDPNTGTSLSYVLDSVPVPRLYRITLNIGSQTISRAYVPQKDMVHPAGAWVRKE